MKLLTETKFLDIFEGPNSKTLREFINTARVIIRDRIVLLKEYTKEKNIPIEDIKLLYEFILNRNEYLSRFYTKSLKIVEPIIIQEKPMPKTKMNNNKLVNYKNIIRNMYFFEILQKTHSGLENLPSFLDVLINLFKKELIDYKILTPSARHYIKEHRLGSILSSFYFRASIMNPYLVYSLHETLLLGQRIFSPTLGWSSYAYGFLSCPSVSEYVATDVIPHVCTNTQLFCNEYFPEKRVDIYCSPSEELAKNKLFLKTYREYFDTVFFSPPYYELELYPGKKQSTTQYKSYEEWLEKYWMKTIEMCFYVLKPGGKLCYILSNYNSNMENSQGFQIDILEDMNNIVKRFFIKNDAKHRMMIPMHNKNDNMTGENHRETAEKIMIFIK